MTASLALSLLAACGHAALAWIVWRFSRTAIRVPLAALCIDFVCWTLASAVNDIVHAPLWRALDVGSSPFTAPIALHVVVSFVGRPRASRRKRVLGAAYASAALVGLHGALVAFGVDVGLGSRGWAIGTLAVAVGCIVPAIVWLLRHVRAQQDVSERRRTWYVLVATVVGTLLCGSELLWPVVPGLPSLGPLGSLLTTATLAVAVVRHELLERAASRLELALSALIAVSFVALLASLAVIVPQGAGWYVLFFVLGVGVLSAVVFDLRARERARRERERELVALGRLDAQMAHDLKNPLAALQGGLQVLAVAAERGDDLREHAVLVPLMLEQVARISSGLDRYRRLARVAPRLESTDVTGLVTRVIDAARTASPHVAFTVRVPEGASLAELDGDLVQAALENVVRNAVEALGERAGHVAVSLEQDAEHLCLVVRDDGPGMSARTRDSAFEELFTTKPNGSGLGLALVRRVARAHGGEVAIVSALGAGCEVRITIPRPAAREASGSR